MSSSLRPHGSSFLKMDPYFAFIDHFNLNNLSYNIQFMKITVFLKVILDCARSMTNTVKLKLKCLFFLHSNMTSFCIQRTFSFSVVANSEDSQKAKAIWIAKQKSKLMYFLLNLTKCFGMLFFICIDFQFSFFYLQGFY